MADARIEWAGVRCHPVHHHDARFFREPGLFGFARSDRGQPPLLLFAGQADLIAVEAGASHPSWAEALLLGMNTLYVSFPIPRRIDRLQLLSRIVARVQPILNVIEEAHGTQDTPSAQLRAAGGR